MLKMMKLYVKHNITMSKFTVTWVPPTQEHEIPVANIVNDIVEHAVENDQLTLPSQVTPPSWLAEVMINMNAHSVSATNEESMNMPSQPTELNNEIIHFLWTIDQWKKMKDIMRHKMKIMI